MPRLRGKCFDKGEGTKEKEGSVDRSNFLIFNHDDLVFLGGGRIFLKERIRFGTKWTKFSFVY